MNLLENNLRILVDGKRVVSGIIAACGSAENEAIYLYGNRSEASRDKDGVFRPDIRPMTMETIFDLASVTKLFTCVALLQLRERGRLRLCDPVGEYAPGFKQIADVSLLELMSFQAGLKTRERIDAQPDRNSALSMLFSVEKAPLPERRYYTDIGAMVLKYVVESAGGLSFFDYIKDNVFLPLGMKHSYARIPVERREQAVNYNYERRIQGARYSIDCLCPPGAPHDPKARVIQNGTEDLCGHAGLFSTAADMVSFAQGMLSGKLLSRETLLEMGVNRTGVQLRDGTFSQHCGLMCFSKHPVQTYSEVPSCFGGRAVALSGFTGNHISFDPERNAFMLLLSNRIHNRITFANGRPDPLDNTTQMLWPDGNNYPVSQNYVYMQDRYIKEPMAEMLGIAG